MGSSGGEYMLDWIASLRSQNLTDASRYTSYTCVVYVYARARKRAVFRALD
jgi:hypothetical protein